MLFVKLLRSASRRWNGPFSEPVPDLFGYLRQLVAERVRMRGDLNDNEPADEPEHDDAGE